MFGKKAKQQKRQEPAGETLPKKKQPYRGLKRRWLMGSMVTIGVIVLAVVVIISVSTAGTYYNSARTGLEAKARTASDFFENYITKTYAEFYDSAYKYASNFEDANSIELQFVNTSGRVVVSSYGITAGTAPGSDDVITALETGKIASWRGRRETTGEHLMAVSSPIIYSNGQIIGVMRYVTSLRIVDAEIIKTIAIAVAAAIAVMLLVIFMNLFFIRSVVDPLREITAATRRIADGSYGVQIAHKYTDEVGEMAEAVNDMSIKISQADKTQMEFISSVSHELRTPLTAISGWAETLAYDETLDGDTKRGLGIILREAKRLTKMVEELLDFTRLQDGRFTLNAKPINVADELEESIFAYRELLDQEGMNIEYYPSARELPEITGDPERLRQVFLNIFDNAAKYAAEGKRILVYTGSDGEDIIIRIRDFGAGIPEDDLENVKMKFYKGNSKKRGSGIGLAVCDEIIRYHGGTLTLSNADGGGTEVEIRLPIELTF